MEENVRQQMVEWGKMAGEINKKRGSKYFSKIGKAGAKVRWAKNKAAKKTVSKKKPPCNSKTKKVKSSGTSVKTKRTGPGEKGANTSSV